jgi:epoxyqueuosine reductase
LTHTDPHALARLIATTIHQAVTTAGKATPYRPPLVAFASAADPGFATLRTAVHDGHALPVDLLPDPPPDPDRAAVVSFFLPFAPSIVEANARQRQAVAREWAVAYLETNALIGELTAHLVDLLAARGIHAAGEPATHNFDPVTLRSRWSHKSVAVIAGLGSFGLHQMVITDAGCAGRFGSLVVDAPLPAGVWTGKEVVPVARRERCLYFHDGSCLECIARCPAAALSLDEPLDKQGCYAKLLHTVEVYRDIGYVDACGKCAVGPCALESAVPAI